MSQSTYEIQRSALAWLEGIEDAEGEITAEADAQLAQLEGAIEEKAAALFYARQRCKAMQAEASELASVARAQKERWTKAEARVMDLLRVLLEAREATGGDPKVAGGWGTASIRRTKSLVVADADAVPDSWMRENVTVSLDKTAITKALKAGESVPGCELVDKTSATIRSK